MGLPKNSKIFFPNIEFPEPPTGLFDRIILAVKREEELRRSKRLLFGFSTLLVLSLAVTPVSGAALANQIKQSGISYFISAAVADWRILPVLWQDLGLAVLESLPVEGLVGFFSSLAVCAFTLRLFLSRKRLLFGYLRRSFI